MAEQEQKQPELEIQEQTGEVPGGAQDAAGAAAGSAGPEQPSGDEPSLDDVVGQLQDDLVAARDLALRAQAEAQNVQRRAQQDVEKARKFALEQFAKELLPVADNLERALQAAGEEDAARPVAEGVELTLKSLLDVLARFQIRPVDPQGEPFDPNLHQAMTMVENPEVEPNTVIGVMMKGYTLHDRLLRPAMVMVSKAANG